jgi:hypothetical protein
MKLKDIKKGLKKEAEARVPDVIDGAKKAPINRLLTVTTPEEQRKKRTATLLLVFVLAIIIVISVAVFSLVSSALEAREPIETDTPDAATAANFLPTSFDETVSFDFIGFEV